MVGIAGRSGGFDRGVVIGNLSDTPFFAVSFPRAKFIPLATTGRCIDFASFSWAFSAGARGHLDKVSSLSLLRSVRMLDSDSFVLGEPFLDVCIYGWAWA